MVNFEVMKPPHQRVETAWRIVPESTLQTVLHPPGHDIKPIGNEFYCLEYGYNHFSGGQRKQGVYDGFIGSDLRMHVLVNARDEVLATWESSEGRP